MSNFETKIEKAIADLQMEMENVKKKVRAITELRYTPSTKKEIRDYIDWSVNQRKKHKK
jgi:hypothetical protein|tara:strand:+ start:855 stop:1031 length:177 start_codon:yes stop_codon:yes gene_type:complete